jgi:phosphatidylserine/phosphatidylglycerophosphate/cardiolipin synthase-like enzyme
VRVTRAACAIFALWSTDAVSAQVPQPRAGYDDFEIVESAPSETTLDHPFIRDAADVWLEMVRSARRTIDLAQFYLSNEAGSRLDAVVVALEQAGARGVKVRVVAERSFHSTYPETLDRLAKAPNTTVRLLDLRARSGGILHAKYFVVDREQVFLGSQNFDWRSLEHIQELGVRMTGADVAGFYQGVFETDWQLAAPGAVEAGATAQSPLALPIRRVEPDGEVLLLTPTMSPTGWIPCASCWDEPALVALIDGAREDVRVQLLTYRPVTREGEYYATLENALRRAAARGVRVKLLLSDWCLQPTTRPYLESLGLVPNVEVRLVTIPQSSRGFIPFARVIHAKLLVVDAERAWVGTSNWEKDYFHASRNVGVVVQNPRVGRLFADFFASGWGSTYAYALRPGVEYPQPRINE